MDVQKNKLFVGNLPFSLNDGSLAAVFTDADPSLKVVEAKVITDRDSGRSKGFGFVTLETDEMAELAITAVNGKEFDGRALTVNIARPMEKRDDRRPFNRSY